MLYQFLHISFPISSINSISFNSQFLPFFSKETVHNDPFAPFTWNGNVHLSIVSLLVLSSRDMECLSKIWGMLKNKWKKSSQLNPFQNLTKGKTIFSERQNLNWLLKERRRWRWRKKNNFLKRKSSVQKSLSFPHKSWTDFYLLFFYDSSRCLLFFFCVLSFIHI